MVSLVTFRHYECVVLFMCTCNVNVTVMFVEAIH